MGGAEGRGSSPAGRASGSGGEEGKGLGVAWHTGLQTACVEGPSKGGVFVKD